MATNLSSDWTAGTGNPKIEYPIGTTKVNFSNYDVQEMPNDKSRNIIVRKEADDYSVHDELIGRKLEYEFIVRGVSASDLTSWDSMNGEEVRFYPHEENTDYIDCICFITPMKIGHGWHDAVRFDMIGKELF